MIKKFLFAVSILLGVSSGLVSQTVRIMPLGNSITYDENSLDASYPRSDANRISYRYRLYQLLYEEGYDFDYVGSEDCGFNYFQNPELDDNAGFSGIETWQLANLINTGYNAVEGHYESSGPYLNYYPADIILLHIGTNDLIESASEVKDLLDNIRYHDPDVYILVAKIINRRVYHASTTTFNNNVDLMVTMRGDPRIKMVNMETGAGINYSTDMIDNLHPNQAGFVKMGEKWFDAVKNLNQAPVVSQIPDQFTSRESAFAPISLDDYVTDSEDPNNLLTWTFTRKLGSQLIVSIDENRMLMVSPNGDWSGTELLSLKVTDTGSGALPRNSTMEVSFTVDKGNDPPVIASNPVTVINQEENYSYTVQAYDIDGDSIIYSVVQKPSWLNFSVVTHQLSGIPHHEHVGVHDITLRVADAEDYTEQSFQLEVIDVNDPPMFTSIPEVEVDQGKLYSYVIKAIDLDGDPLAYSVVEIPAWLQYNSQTRVISGTPDFQDIGEYDVIIQVSDGNVEVIQSYQLSVINANDPPEFISEAVTEVVEKGDYYYNVIAQDIDGDLLTYSAPLIPEWLSFDPFSRTLVGQPDNDQVGTHHVIVRVSDGFVEIDQIFELTVINVNDQPIFTTEPLTEARAMEAYIYRIVGEDVDLGDILNFTAIAKPDWLTLSSGSNDALLFGTPNKSHIGSHAVIIQLSDGHVEVMQGFTLKVLWPTAVEDFTMEGLNVYPNPSDGVFYFSFGEPGEVTLHIYNSMGILKKTIISDFSEQFEVNISEFERGIYLYKAILNGKEETGKLIKN